MKYAMSSPILVRLMTEDDLRFADGVRESAGWNQTLADWRRLITHEASGCFIAEWEGAFAGTVTTTRHGKDLAWIGMMLVHPDYRRRGIATILMNTAIEYLRGRGVSCIKLDATPDGVPVYERLGFRAEFELHRWEGVLEAGKETESRVALPLPLEFDSLAFGTDRSKWLYALAEDAKMVRVLGDEQGEPIACGMARRGMRANYLGPISAVNEAAGRQLAVSLIKGLDGPTFWDIPEANQKAIQLAEAYGFRRIRPLLRMWMGERCIEGNPMLQFGLGDPGTG